MVVAALLEVVLAHQVLVVKAYNSTQQLLLVTNTISSNIFMVYNTSETPRVPDLRHPC